MASADAIAHLTSDFYVFATWFLSRTSSLEEVKRWVLKKVERDTYVKIFFDDERTQVLADYEAIKRLYSR